MSQSERAVLELLSDVGVRQPLQEARELLEAVPSLRAAVLQELLARCKQVKTVRLCLMLGRELDLPWAERLDPKLLPTGSQQRWVGRSKEGLLVLKSEGRRAGRGLPVEPMFTDVSAWFAELDRLASEPFMPEGRQQPPTPQRDVFDDDVPA